MAVFHTILRLQRYTLFSIWRNIFLHYGLFMFFLHLPSLVVTCFSQCSFHRIFHQRRGESVGQLHQCTKGIFILCRIDIAFCLRTLERQVPCSHMPPDGSYLGIGQVKAKPQQYDYAFLTVPQREIAIVHIISAIFFPPTESVLPFLCGLNIDIGLANVMQKCGNGHTVLPVRVSGSVQWSVAAWQLCIRSVSVRPSLPHNCRGNGLTRVR